MSQQSLDRFVRHLRATKRENTALTYEKAIVRYEHWLSQSGIELEAAGKKVVNDFVAWAKEDSYSGSTITTWVAAISKYHRFLRSEGENVPELTSIDTPRASMAEPEALTDSELVAFMETASQHILEPARTALLLMPFCGLRSSEIASLKMDSIIIVKEGKESQVYFKMERKGGNVGRAPLLKEGKLLLQGYLVNFRNAHKKKSVYLFPGNDKGHVGTRTLRDGVELVRDILRLDKPIKTHTLRKTYATMLYNKGVPVAEISRNMGHKSVDMTMKAYIGHDIQRSMNAVKDVSLVGDEKVKEITNG